MLAATIAIAFSLGAAEATKEAPVFRAARVDITRLLDAIDLAPVRYGVRSPGPTRYGMHYWIDPENSNNEHSVHFLVVAVLADEGAARAHYDRLRARAGGAPDAGDRDTGDRFAIRFNADANATDLTLTQGNVYIALRAGGEREGVEALARGLREALGRDLIAPAGEPEPLPAPSLTHGPGRGNRVEIITAWEGEAEGAMPQVVLFRTDGEYIAMADADGTAEVGRFRFDTIDAFMVVAGWPDNRWESWEIAVDDIRGEDAP